MTPFHKSSPLLECCQGQAAVSLELQHKVFKVFLFFFFFLISVKCSGLFFLTDSPPHTSLSSQGFLTFLGFRRLRDITFQEEYNTLFPNSPSLLP